MLALSDNQNITRSLIRNHAFRSRNPDYCALRRKADVELSWFKEHLDEMTLNGDDTPLMRELYIYAKWLTQATDHWALRQRILKRLQNAMTRPTPRELAQCWREGTWSQGFEELHHKLDTTVDQMIEACAHYQPLRYGLSFMEPISTPDKLVAFLDHAATSRIHEDGRDRRDEYGGLLSTLSQLFFKKDLARMIRSHRSWEGFDACQRTFEDYLMAAQDPASGYWGPSYETPDGKTHRFDDLSYTYHIVSYRRGDIPNWKALIDRTLELQHEAYPVGWKVNGGYNDHNNYDVAKIFRFGWKHMTPGQRVDARNAMQEMLDWTLKDDGEDAAFYNSADAALYYRISFLDVAGVFDPAKRFWTDDLDLEPESLLWKFRTELGQFDSSSSLVASSLRRLPPVQPICFTTRLQLEA